MGADGRDRSVLATPWDWLPVHAPPRITPIDSSMPGVRDAADPEALWKALMLLSALHDGDAEWLVAEKALRKRAHPATLLPVHDDGCTPKALRKAPMLLAAALRFAVIVGGVAIDGAAPIAPVPARPMSNATWRRRAALEPGDPVIAADQSGKSCKRPQVRQASSVII